MTNDLSAASSRPERRVRVRLLQPRLHHLVLARLILLPLLRHDHPLRQNIQGERECWPLV